MESNMEMLLSGLTGYIEDLTETTVINLYEFIEDYELPTSERVLNKVWRTVRLLDGVSCCDTPLA